MNAQLLDGNGTVTLLDAGGQMIYQAPSVSDLVPFLRGELYQRGEAHLRSLRMVFSDGGQVSGDALVAVTTGRTGVSTSTVIGQEHTP